MGRIEGFVRPADFDNKYNPSGRLTGESFFYPEGITEAFKGSVYREWGVLFTQMAKAGIDLDYNRMMAGSRCGLTGMIEYLFKGEILYAPERKRREYLEVWLWILRQA